MIYDSLNAAMEAGDELAEARIRYRLLAETFEAMPSLRSNLNPQLERAKAEIARLRAAAVTGEKKPLGKVVAFDADRFRKSGA
ncbi:hypothetical protein [Mycobacterium sp. P7213]|uniref:hypothetical protein n=1 Tax=Mycobacterium sp. P7213 TaxID=2478465 RepID=UPI000F629A03|nr:hypothetical protein [Mycobacterium sp. P7213]